MVQIRQTYWNLNAFVVLGVCFVDIHSLTCQGLICIGTSHSSSCVHLTHSYCILPEAQWYTLMPLFLYCYLISPFSASVYAVIEGPVFAEGDQCVTVVLGSVFSILVILCFCILLFIMRKKLVKCLHYAPVRPRSYPLVSGKFDALNQWRTEGGVWGVQTPPRNSKVLTQLHSIANWAENV